MLTIYPLNKNYKTKNKQAWIKQAANKKQKKRIIIAVDKHNCSAVILSPLSFEYREKKGKQMKIFQCQKLKQKTKQLSFSFCFFFFYFNFRFSFLF